VDGFRCPTKARQAGTPVRSAGAVVPADPLLNLFQSVTIATSYCRCLIECVQKCCAAVPSSQQGHHPRAIKTKLGQMNCVLDKKHVYDKTVSVSRMPRVVNKQD
jgi:hypothetical protein